MKWTVWCGVVALVALCTGVAQAQLLANPVGVLQAGQFEAGGEVAMTTVEYELDSDGGDDEGEVKRTLVGGYGAYGLNEMFDLYGMAGFIFKAEPEDWDDSGNGFLFGGGTRALIFSGYQLNVHAYGEFRYLSEDYGEEEDEHRGIKITREGSAKGYEVAAGALVAFQPMDEWCLYGGLEVAPFASQDLEIESKAQGQSEDDSIDIERESILGLRGGGMYKVDQYFIRGEVGLLNETSFSIGGGATF